MNCWFPVQQDSVLMASLFRGSVIQTWILAHWGSDKMATISQTSSLNAFSWMQTYAFGLRLRWSLFLNIQLTILQYWFRWWLDVRQATSHYLNQWWLDYRCIYASFGLKELTDLHDSFRPGDAVKCSRDHSVYVTRQWETLQCHVIFHCRHGIDSLGWAACRVAPLWIWSSSVEQNPRYDTKCEYIFYNL